MYVSHTGVNVTSLRQLGSVSSLLHITRMTFYCHFFVDALGTVSAPSVVLDIVLSFTHLDFLRFRKKKKMSPYHLANCLNIFTHMHIPLHVNRVETLETPQYTAVPSDIITNYNLSNDRMVTSVSKSA